MQNSINLATGYMPLIDFNLSFCMQIFNFLVLFLFLRWKLFMPITNVLENRKNTIEKSYEDADVAVKEAEELKAMYQEKINGARLERDEIISKARNTANKQASDIIKAAEEEAELIKRTAEKQIEADKQKAMASAKDDIAAMAVLAAAKILKREIDSKTNSEMIAEFIEGVGEVKWDK